MTSGTLYSVFKEPRPRAFQAPRNRAVPPARDRKNIRLATDLPV